MKIILNFFKFCWKLLNFIRNLVMNLIFLFFVLSLMAVFTLIFNPQKDIELVGEQGALLLNLNGYLADNRDDMNWGQILQKLDNKDMPSQISTFDIVYAIEIAKEDERIKGLVLDLNYFEGADLPALEYVGRAIMDFKEHNKPVIAFADNYTQAQYLLASYADEIYLNPIGQVGIQGFSSQNFYFKSMLEKLKITPHVFRVGTYKSAVEPFLYDEMSPEARANMQQWLGNMWENYQNIIAKNRQISSGEVLPDIKTYLAQLKVLKGDNTAYAKQRKLITKVADHANLNKKLIELFGMNRNEEPKLIEFNTYLSALPDRMSMGQENNKIAVINVEGTIIDGESYQQEVGGDTIARLLRRAGNDNTVKAVILRVNTPGGSAFASEIIRQEVDNLQQSGKPVVVSMGGMAASGGYWISSTADYIVADKNTITGSIGIFSVFPTFEEALKNMGITADGVTTSELSNISLFSPLSPEIQDIFQLQIEYGYDQFLSIISKGRGIAKEDVDKIAQGKIWLGQEAYNYNLVDQLGNFDTAVAKASELVNLKLSDEKKINHFSVQWFVDEDSSFFKKLLSDFKQETKLFMQNAMVDMIGLPKEMGELKKPFGVLNQFNDPKGQYLYCLNCAIVK